MLDGTQPPFGVPERPAVARGHRGGMEVRDDQVGTGAAHAPELPIGGREVRKMAQDESAPEEIERGLREGKAPNVGRDEWDRFLDRAADPEHLRNQIHTDGAARGGDMRTQAPTRSAPGIQEGSPLDGRRPLPDDAVLERADRRLVFVPGSPMAVGLPGPKNRPVIQ